MTEDVIKHVKFSDPLIESVIESVIETNADADADVNNHAKNSTAPKIVFIVPYRDREHHLKFF
jgi:hypothetical protein